MITKYFKKIFIVTNVVLMAIFLFCSHSNAEGDDIFIIVNPNSPEQKLSLKRIQNIYTGKVTLWSSNEPIILAVLKDEDLHKAFLKKYVKRNSFQFKNTWRQMVFSGKGKQPISFGTIEELMNFISTNRLAIGYINENSAGQEVKTIIH